MLKLLFNSICNFTTPSELLTVPIGLSYIKSYCETNFPCSIKIVPVINERVLTCERPDIVGLSCYAATYSKADEIAEMCKGRGIHVVVGGEQISTLPHLLTRSMDVGVRGEGEHTFLKLLECFDNGWDKERLKHRPSLVFHDESGELVITESASRPSVDLDAIPIPDLLLGNENSDLLCLMSSRGCPYNCVFCATGWHNSVHWMSPEKVVETIAYHVERYPRLRRVKFWDDLFSVKFHRVERIVELLEQRGLAKRLSFSICTRADHINEPLLKLLKRMNCTHVSMGLESGCDKTLEFIRKQTTAEMNRRAVELLHSYGFGTEASFIIGFPHETDRDIRETYEFIKNIPIDKIQVFLPVPYPGTRLWQHALERGAVSEKMNWEILDLIATMGNPKSVLKGFPILSEELSRKELLGWLMRFMRLRQRKTIVFGFALLAREPRVVLERLKREARFLIRKIGR